MAIMAGPVGNAGSFAMNAFKIRIGIAAPNIRAITNYPTLLEQTIAPGTYVSVLTLNAFPEI